MLKKDKTDIRKGRHDVTQEDFTPDGIVKAMLKQLPKDAFTDFTKKIVDPSAGIGNFLMWALNKRLKNARTATEAINAVYFLFGVEIMADNVQECRERLYKLVIYYFPEIEGDEELNYKLREIIRNRIQWCNTFNFDFDSWPKITFDNAFSIVSFEERPKENNPNYPMWEE